MGMRLHNFIEDEYFHIYNRGNDKHEIFLDHQDYDRFVKLLYVCNSERKFTFRDSIISQKIDAWDFDRGEPMVDISAWVLMPNHFHLLAVSHRSDLWEKGYNPITEYMRKVSTAYVMYFNKKYQRTGSLFEGKFKSKHVSKDNYFNYLFAYIHLNPMKLIQSDWKEKGVRDVHKAQKYLSEYRYSSFQDYFGKERKEVTIINRNIFPESIEKVRVTELFEWIKIAQ